MSSFADSFSRYLQLGGFWKKRTNLYRDMATALLEKELPKDFVEGELQISMSRQTSDRDRARGLMYMRNLMEQGDPTLHEVLVSSMPKSDSMALTTLRDAKNRPEALKQLAESIDQQNELTSLVRNSLISPAILVPVGFVFAYILSTVSIPEFAKAAPDEIWTGFVGLVRDSANVMANYGPTFFATFIAWMAWLLVWALPNLTSTWRFKAESARGLHRVLWTLVFPFQFVLAMYRDIQSTRMLSNLANLLQSGMLLMDALYLLAEGSQPWMRKHILKVVEHLQYEAGDYVGAFGHGLLSPFLLGRMRSMVRRDAGGKFDQVLIELGSKGQLEARESVKSSATKINAILLFLTMSIITFFYVGQGMIARAIEDANSPSAILKRQANKSVSSQSSSNSTTSRSTTST